MPKVCLPFNKSNFSRTSKILKSFKIHSIPIVDRSLKAIIKLAKKVAGKW